MEKWTIKPAPTTQDPRRHVLLLKGDMKDVAALLKKFGALCGRPAPEKSPEGFNFSLFLHGLNEPTLERVKAALGELGGVAGGISSAPAPVSTITPPPPLVSLAPAPAPSLAPPSLEPPAIPPLIAPPPALETLPPPIPAPPSLEPPMLPPLAPPPPDIALPPPDIALPPPDIAPPPAPIPAPAPAPAPTPEISAPPASSPAPAPDPGPSIPALSPALAGQPLFGLASPLDPLRVFESLQVGAYNRFAHAAATSVIGSPGTMYNPLFLYGAPGVGKSHMAQAIAHGLGAALGKDNIIMTTGARLGRAVSLAFAAKKLDEIEAVVAKSKALVVDDLHLLSVTEINTPALAKIFGVFFSANLQVVLTAMYPPRALGALEEALKISFGKGWSVDLKLPNANVQREIVHSQLDRSGMTMTNDEVTSFIERLGSNYGEAAAWVRRLVVMHRLSQRLGTNAKPDELSAILFNPDPQAAGQEMPSGQQLASVKGFAPPAAGADATSLVVVVPKLQEHLREWVIARFHQVGGQFRIPQNFRHVGFETYDAQQPFGVPFSIGETCARSGAQAAIIVGPPADSQLAARVGEFSHAVGHILESIGVRMAWLPHNGTMSASNFLRAQLDCLPDSNP